MKETFNRLEQSVKTFLGTGSPDGKNRSGFQYFPGMNPFFITVGKPFFNPGIHPPGYVRHKS